VRKAVITSEHEMLGRWTWSLNVFGGNPAVRGIDLLTQLATPLFT